MFKKGSFHWLTLCGGVAIAAMLALIVFFVHTLSLRSDYRDTCMEINAAILAVPAETCTAEQFGEVWPADDALLNFYDRWLLDRHVTAFSRKDAEPSESSITLGVGPNTLRLTGLEDGTAVALRWETPDGISTYTVRTTGVTFMQLSAYMQNYASLKAREE